MKKSISIQINLGIGDHIFSRIFLESVKHKYDRIFITHARDALAYWFNNDPVRREFNNKFATLVYNEPPYVFVPNPNIRFPFYPNERIVKELNNKPVKTNFDCLCVGKSLDINKYVVLTTKIRHIPSSVFEQFKSKLTPALQLLSDSHTIVILGEREVERSREYDAECNRDQIYGIYNYLIDILPSNKILDLSIPALGITCSTLSQLQQDCLIMREADAVLTFGIGGNFWIAASVAKQTIGLRADSEWITDLICGYPGIFLTKNIDEFVALFGKL